MKTAEEWAGMWCHSEHRRRRLAELFRQAQDDAIGAMRCSCVSANNHDGRVPAVFLSLNERPVSVDACIAPAVSALWAAGIETAASCCGHGIQPPSIALVNPDDKWHAAQVVAGVDRRLFDWHCTAGDQCANYIRALLPKGDK